MEKINKDGAKENIKTEYDDYYGNLVDNLVKQNEEILIGVALKKLVEKYIQRLNHLRVVFYDNNIMNVALMHQLGDDIFFRYSCFYPPDGFYISLNDTIGTPAVEKADGESMRAIKNCVLELLAQDEKREEISIFPHDVRHWIFKCQYSLDNVGADMSGETFFEVVGANNFEEATKQLLKKLSDLTADIFFDFEFWQADRFVKLFTATVNLKREPVLVSKIGRSNIPANEFIFIICPEVY